MRVLVDTNILLRSAQPSHPLCPQATRAVSKLLRQNDAVFFCSKTSLSFGMLPGTIECLLTHLNHEPVDAAQIVLRFKHATRTHPERWLSGRKQRFAKPS